jgi:hypothetical protein
MEMPSGLNQRAKDFWNELHSTYKITGDSLVALESIVKTMALIDRLESQIDYSDLVYETFQGARGMNPLVVEVRMQRTLLNTLIKALGLPSASSTMTAEQRSAYGRDLVSARWNKAA